MGFIEKGDFREKELAPGVRIRVAWGEKTMISFVNLSPDAVIPIHSHPHEQMGMVIEGEFEMTIASETRTVKQGDSYLVPGGVEHSVRNYGAPSVALDIFSPPREDYMS